MASVLVFLLVVVVFGGTALYAVRRGGVSTLDEARADADHWYDLLRGQVLNLTVTANETVKQAVGDASERYNTAGAQRATAQTVAAYRSVRDTSLEGLHFIRAARTAMGFEPGPDLPPTSTQFQAGQLRDTQRFSTPDGQTIEGRPQPTADNPSITRAESSAVEACQVAGTTSHSGRARCWAVLPRSAARCCSVG
jgi:hypothetical protein